MAEAIARGLVADGRVEGVASKDVFFASAGTWATDGTRFSPETLDVLRERGLTLDGRSKRVNPEMVAGADLVLGMTRAHVDALRAMANGRLRRCELALEPYEVDDPVGLGIGAYRRVARQLSELLPARLSEMLHT